MRRVEIKRNVALAILLVFFAGLVSGIWLQRNAVPRLVRRAVRSCFTRTGTTAIHPDRASITLATRTLGPIPDGDGRSTRELHEMRTLGARTVALVLIDVWARDPDPGFQERSLPHMRRTIVPLVELARRHGLAVIHSHNREPEAEEMKPVKDEFVVDPDNLPDDTDELDRYLKAHTITTLLYAGYQSNVCVLFRPTGMLAMKGRGYNIVLVRDCTLAYETPETLGGEWNNKAMATLVETSLGATTTLEDIREAFGELPRKGEPGPDAAEKEIAQ